MEKFSVHTGVTVPMMMTNINTDLIAPSLMPGRTPEEAASLSLKDKLFGNLRYDKEGVPRADFVLISRAIAKRVSCWQGRTSVAAARARPRSGR